MNKEDIIQLEDNKEYMILDVIELEEIKYLMTVELDKNDLPTTNYKYFEVIEEDDGNSVEEVEDKNVLETIISLFTMDYINDSIDTNEEQDA